MARKLSDVEKKASLKVLSDYRGEAQSLMKDKMKKMKESKPKDVTAAALMEAEDLLDHDDEDTDLEEYSEEMTDDDSTENEDDLDQKIAELMAMKKKMESRRNS